MPPRKSAAKPAAKRKAQDPADTAAPAEDVKKDDAVQVLPASIAVTGTMCVFRHIVTPPSDHTQAAVLSPGA